MDKKLNKRLQGITTQHPGGYVDIVETMLNSTATVMKIDYVSQPAEPGTVDEKGNPVTRVLVEIKTPFAVSEIAQGLVMKITDTGSISRCSGMLAGEIQTTLARWRLPLPDDPKWLEPAKSWF